MQRFEFHTYQVFCSCTCPTQDKAYTLWRTHTHTNTHQHTPTHTHTNTHTNTHTDTANARGQVEAHIRPDGPSNQKVSTLHGKPARMHQGGQCQASRAPTLCDQPEIDMFWGNHAGALRSTRRLSRAVLVFRGRFLLDHTIRVVHTQATGKFDVVLVDMLYLF